MTLWWAESSEAAVCDSMVGGSPPRLLCVTLWWAESSEAAECDSMVGGGPSEVCVVFTVCTSVASISACS